MQHDGETGSGSDDTILKKPVLDALAAVGLTVILAAAAMGAGTTIGPTGANFTSGDLSGIGSMDGGGNSIAVNDNLGLNDNNLTGGEIMESDQFTTVHNTSLKAIDEAIDKYSYVKLRPTTYTGESTINITENDVGNDDGLALDMSGATLNYTGNSGSAINIDLGGKMSRKVSLRDGVIIGESGTFNDGTRGVRVEDTAATSIDVTQIAGFEYGIYLRNNDAWTEANQIDITRMEDNNVSIFLEGATSTGGSGTDSFQNTVMNALMLHPKTTGIYFKDAELTEMDVRTNVFVPDNGEALKFDTSSGARGSEFRLWAETQESSPTGATGIKVIEWGGSPLFTTKQLQNLNTNIDNQDSTPVLEFGKPDAGDRIDASATQMRFNTEFRILQGSSGSGEDQLMLNDADGTSRTKIGTDAADNSQIITSNGGNFLIKPNNSIAASFKSGQQLQLYGHTNVANNQNHAIIYDDAGSLRIEDDGGFDTAMKFTSNQNVEVPNGVIDMKSNNITNTDMYDLNDYGGNLPTCEAGTSGNIMYNGTHWGCDGTSWNKLY